MDLSIAELKMTSVPTVRAVPTGRQYRASNGKMKDETICVEYARITTREEMPMDEWYKRMDEAVEREEQTALVQAITDYCRKHCAWLRTEAALHNYALDVLSSEAYRNWRGFRKMVARL